MRSMDQESLNNASVAGGVVEMESKVTGTLAPACEGHVLKAPCIFVLETLPTARTSHSGVLPQIFEQYKPALGRAPL